MSFSEVLKSIFSAVSDEITKKSGFYGDVKNEVEKLKSKSTRELQKIANGWEPAARKKAAQMILDHRNQ